jgi:hypothetical protein
MKVNKNVFKVLTAVLLAASFVMTSSPMGGRFEGTAIAESRPQGKKIAPDVEEAIGLASERTLQVIVETAPSSRSNAFSKFSARVGELGGVVRLALNGGKSAAVEIAATALDGTGRG